jgi:hypothetical protein
VRKEIFLGISDFTGRHGCHFKTSESINKQQLIAKTLPLERGRGEACGLRKKRPAAMKMIIGINLPTVKRLLTMAACRTPRTFRAVNANTIETMIVGRQMLEEAPVQK